MATAETRSELLSRGARSLERRAWGDAYRRLREADAHAPLDPSGLEALARAAYLLGRESESLAALERAHAEAAQRGDASTAARSALFAAFQLMGRGEHARGGGWLARARRVLDESGEEGPERGLLLALEALRQLGAGELEAARATFEQAAEIGRRLGDVDVTSLGRLGQGQAMVRGGDLEGGLALLDEVMLAVTADEVSPVFAGVIYCAVLEACHEIHDLRRAHEWSAALDCWCASQPDLVPFRGECLVRRAELMRVHGAWGEALEAVEAACDRLSNPPRRGMLGAALYQQAELHRVRGELAEAEEAYRRASEAGRQPQPGLALLRLAQGNVRAAKAAVDALCNETRAPAARARMLPACVEVFLEAGDAAAARAAAEELAALAGRFRAPLLRAAAAGARGAVLLAEGAPGEALGALGEALGLWEELGAPYEGARTRVRVARARHALGDEDGATLEIAAARSAFERLGARTELERAVLEPGPRPAAPGGLTARELEVLRLVATGRTNRAIAAELHISEKTVARHVSNIFVKLGVTSRAAATAYAYEHGLV
ncbi:MAG TPA: LuxR C-terminal-related transcriptional regulator [Longimicrobiales bacterium]|nr:LuxR C-terminal-related transcriptional regulator [Longimicrobiales bacterium]